MLKESSIGKKLEIAKPKEIADSPEVKAKVAHARKIFSYLLHIRTRKKSMNDVGFTLTFENMAIRLELYSLPKGILQAQMDDVVLSVPGMAKTATGYTVSDVNLLLENFGPGSTRKRIVDFLSKNPHKLYSIREVATELDFIDATAASIIKDLVVEGKIIIAEKKRDTRGALSTTQYQIADQGQL